MSAKRQSLGKGLDALLGMADETHVVENRQMYDEKYALADEIFASVCEYRSPPGGFFLWLPVEDGEHHCEFQPGHCLLDN